MSRFEKGAEKARLPLTTRAKLAGGAVAAVLVGIMSGCGANGPREVVPPPVKPNQVDEGLKSPTGSIYDPAVKRVVRPAMVEAGRQIVAASEAFPELTHKIVGKNIVILSITGHADSERRDGATESDFTSIWMSTDRTPGSQAPDLSRIRSETVSRSISVRGEPQEVFTQNFGLYNHQPGLYIATNDFDPLQRGIDSPLLPQRTERPLNSLALGGDAVAIARSVVQTVPNILSLAEADLAFMTPLNGAH